MYVPITIKRKSGKVVKSWQVNGAHNIEEVLQFIWRDLFLSLLATGTQRQINQIPEMLDDIEDIMGWTALERLLYGGRKCPHDEYGPDEEWTDVDSDENEDEDAYTDDDSVLDAAVDGNALGNPDWVAKPSKKTTPSHAKHWSHRISSQMWQFRKHIHAGMLAVFKLNPSLRLYSALLSSSTDPDATGAELMSFLTDTATSCPEVFAAALDIHALENNTATIASLLSTHAHLLRPRDAAVFQRAVAVLAEDPFQQLRALELIEKELLDTVACVRFSLVGPFSRMDSPANKAELEHILKLRPSDRQDRVERWVDAITTPGTGNPNPMALAAMVMGLPLPIVPPLDGAEDADPLGYLDLDPADPDTEDLREEFRPRLKQRFEGWSDTAQRAKGGPGVLLKVYKELAKAMPFLRGADVVEDMLARVSEKPGRQHIIDAVDALAAFAKVQRRKLHKADQKRRANAGTQTPAAAAAAAAGPSTHAPPLPPVFMFEPPPTATGQTVLGDDAEMDQEMDQDDTPPPLEPATPPLPAAALPAQPPPPLFGFYSGPGFVPGPPPPMGGQGGWNGMDDVD
ncbi:hypothetical protein GSI_00104 [Ganoderma sinense ZZ0214-1]|uniref:Uncharacterized protein n=1 Tax=Ganoderma sinense ZZ0214-1 TaxID=1077348 RepID=A0A2G8SRL7_9APHY|nr:hypothetical protein GSI_00104 [Ganoderma sinense ZZ0214-1]